MKVFIFSQFVYTLITFVPSFVMYRSQNFNIFYLVLLFTASVFYGASYYIDVFSQKYQQQFFLLSVSPSDSPGEDSSPEDEPGNSERSQGFEHQPEGVGPASRYSRKNDWYCNISSCVHVDKKKFPGLYISTIHHKT